MISFQEQMQKDLDSVFFNKMAKEFVTTHRIGGVRGGKAPPPVECDIVVDHGLYQGRISKITSSIENINIDGLVFFIKKEDWTLKFGDALKVKNELMFDNSRYYIQSVTDTMGVLEVTLMANKGR